MAAGDACWLRLFTVVLKGAICSEWQCSIKNPRWELVNSNYTSTSPYTGFTKASRPGLFASCRVIITTRPATIATTSTTPPMMPITTVSDTPLLSSLLPLLELWPDVFPVGAVVGFPVGVVVGFPVGAVVGGLVGGGGFGQ